MFITSALIWQMTANTTKFNPYWAGKAPVLRGVKWQFTFTLTFFTLMVQQKHQLVVLSPAIVCVNLLLLLPYCFKLSLCLNCLIHLFWPFQSWHMQLLHLKNKPWSLKIGQPGLFYFNLPLQLSISLPPPFSSSQPLLHPAPGGGHLDNFWVGMCRPGL